MSKKILIADDNHGHLEVLKSFLEKRGYEVITAGDGEEALDKAMSESPDLIVLDVQMPVMDGDEAAMHLKSKQETRAIPVVFVTALRTEAEIEENGEKDIFAKPVPLDRFLAKIKELTAE